MDERTRTIIDQVVKIENWQLENYPEHLNMLLSNTKQLAPFPKDIENERKLFANKKYGIIGTFSVPRHLQALRGEQIRLNSLVDLYLDKKDNKSVQGPALKLARVKTIMRDWREGRVQSIPRLVALRDMGVKLNFTFGGNWMVYVYVEKMFKKTS